MSYDRQARAYRETGIRTASQGKLILMLYDEAAAQIGTAVTLVREGSKQLDKVNAAVQKAQDIITELTVALDMDRGGEVAENLFRLYLYFNQQLFQANLKKDAGRMEQVQRMLGELRESWAQISHLQAEEAPMQRPGINIAG